MITLITGAPGAGKSAAMMELLTGPDYKDRPLFVDGVPELQLPHEVLNVPAWPKEAPDGALCVIDEVQRHWRPRGPGQPITDDIAMLETHRHRGLDFIIITQAPRLLHVNVRALVGRHIHLRDVGLLGRWWYEWPECNESLSYKNAPVKKRYRLPKRVFSLYKSSSLHIKPVRSIPPMVFVGAAAVLGFGYFAWKSYVNISGKTAPSPAAASSPAGAAPGGSGGASPAQPAARQVVAAYSRADFKPRDPNEPLSAPAYDHLRQVVSMPRIVGGWCQVGRPCECRFQDGNVAPIPEPACRDRVMRPRFDPYTKPEVVAAGQPAPAPTGASAPSGG